MNETTDPGKRIYELTPIILRRWCLLGFSSNCKKNAYTSSISCQFVCLFVFYEKLLNFGNKTYNPRQPISIDLETKPQNTKWIQPRQDSWVPFLIHIRSTIKYILHSTVPILRESHTTKDNLFLGGISHNQRQNFETKLKNYHPQNLKKTQTQ